jgi:hypothetical protein
VKLLFLILGAVVFVGIGLLFMLVPEQFGNDRWGSPTIPIVLGVVAVAFFGICLVFMIQKFFDTRMGLTIDDKGITDHTNATSVGLIHWEDITGVKTLQVASTKMLLIQTNQPQKYMERAKNGISKHAMKANHKMYGTPISIVANSLQISFNALEKLISEQLEQRGCGVGTLCK